MRILWTLVGVALIGTSLEAQGWIEPPPNVHGAIVKLRAAVSVRVEGRIAMVEVEEWFENRGGRMGEGDYLYPLPGEAVFSNFSLFQGDQELRGETMDANAARSIYEAIVRRKKDPALIELAGHGLLRARVFPINAGETRKITLRYTQVMERAGDALQFQYAAGGRTGARPVEGGLGPVMAPVDAPIGFHLTAEAGGMFRDPFSPTHDVVAMRDGGALAVRADDLRGDLVLFLPFAREVLGMTLATHRADREDGYFMLTLSPGLARGSALPRDITAVVDISGSMSGEKIDQAKAALRQLIHSLNSGDRFRLVAFSNRVTSYRPGWTAASADRVHRAEQWIASLDANGGTNIEAALTEAFREASGEGRIPLVIFLTDGLPSVGEQNPERIAERAERVRGNRRVFAFGVGYDVNTYLLDRLSDAGRGATQYVRPGEDVETAIGQLSAKIRHPVLADLAVDEVPVNIVEVYPVRLPDLFSGEELVVFGRYRAGRRERSGDLIITGRRNGRLERFSSNVRFPDHTLNNDFIPRLWAARKIGWLSQRLLREGPSTELENEIRDTALRYGLLSEYTSYLVQEPEQVVAGNPRGVMSLRTLDAAPMHAPSEAHGEVAVERARRLQVQRAVKSSAEAERLADALVVGRLDADARHVAGRVFVERKGVWTDTRHASTADTISIRVFSDAYFTVLRALPELEPYVRAFDHVIVSGKAVSIRLGEKGLERLSERRTTQLVESFRGH